MAKAKAAPDYEAYLEELTRPPTTGPGRPIEGRGQSATLKYGSQQDQPDPRPQDLVKRGISTTVARQHKKAMNLVAQGGPSQTKSSRQRRQSSTALVVSAQAKLALQKLGQPYDPNAQRQDPKEVLLALVSSAWQQQQVWEAMLATIPEVDFNQIGVTPIPGDPLTSKGTRIEALQKFLQDATKTAARISKMAIDAGIEERLVRLAEEQQTLIADTVRAGLIAAVADLVKSLRLPANQEQAIMQSALGAAANHLRAIANGKPPEVIDSVAVVIENSKKTAPVAARYRARQAAKAGQMKVVSPDEDEEASIG